MAQILILDDDPQILKMTSVMLTRNGHHVFTAESGEDALTRLQSQNFDLLLTDILMPGVDGIEVINDCRKRKLDVKIVAMSGGRRKISAQFNLKSAEMLGAKAVLAKPFSQQQLLDSIDLVLN